MYNTEVIFLHWKATCWPLICNLWLARPSSIFSTCLTQFSDIHWIVTREPPASALHWSLTLLQRLGGKLLDRALAGVCIGCTEFIRFRKDFEHCALEFLFGRTVVSLEYANLASAALGHLGSLSPTVCRQYCMQWYSRYYSLLAAYTRFALNI